MYVPEPPYFNARCVTCQQPILSGDKIADLDGKPFQAYYHNHPSCLPKGVPIHAHTPIAT